MIYDNANGTSRIQQRGDRPADPVKIKANKRAQKSKLIGADEPNLD